MKPGCWIALTLLVAGAAQAEDVASTIYGGVGVAFREPSDKPPYDQLRLDYDTGTLLHLQVGSHYRYGLLLRLDYAYTVYDELTGGGLTLVEDIEYQEGRAGVFYAPWPRGGVGARIGGGYVYHDEDEDSPPADRSQDGGFVEAGLTVEASKRVSFDFAALGLKVEGEDDYDADGVEARAGVVFRTDALDFSVGLRYLNLDRESPFDETLTELRFGIGGAWGYRENRPPGRR